MATFKDKRCDGTSPLTCRLSLNWGTVYKAFDFELIDQGSLGHEKKLTQARNQLFWHSGAASDVLTGVRP